MWIKDLLNQSVIVHQWDLLDRLSNTWRHSMKWARQFITFPSSIHWTAIYSVFFIASPTPIFTSKLWYPGVLVFKMRSVVSISESLPLAAGWVWSSLHAILFLRNVKNDNPNIAFDSYETFIIGRIIFADPPCSLHAPLIPFMWGTPVSSACVCVYVCEAHTPVHIQTPFPIVTISVAAKPDYA